MREGERERGRDLYKQHLHQLARGHIRDARATELQAQQAFVVSQAGYQLQSS